MTEMVERIRSRICSLKDDDDETLARAILLAMREPTGAMLEQGGELLLDGRLEIEAAEANARGVWRAMINAALGRKP